MHYCSRIFLDIALDSHTFRLVMNSLVERAIHAGALTGKPKNRVVKVVLSILSTLITVIVLAKWVSRQDAKVDIITVLSAACVPWVFNILRFLRYFVIQFERKEIEDNKFRPEVRDDWKPRIHGLLPAFKHYRIRVAVSALDRARVIKEFTLRIEHSEDLKRTDAILCEGWIPEPPLPSILPSIEAENGVSVFLKNNPFGACH